jgi:membrane protease YdiL (CAAX protease family)
MGIGGRSFAKLVEDASWGVVLAVPMVVITTLVAVVLLALLPAPDSPLPPSGTGPGVLFNMLAAVVVAPLSEELFFRGFATTAWLRTMTPWRAIIRGSIFFAAVHILGVGGQDFGDATGRAAVAFFSHLPVAIVLGLLFARRRSLAAPIALHATYNALLFLAQLAAG